MKIALFTGGTSEERLVSLSSGKEVLRALRSRGHTVHTVDTAAGFVSPEEEPLLFPSEVGAEPPDAGSLSAWDESTLFRIIELDVLSRVGRGDGQTSIQGAVRGGWRADGSVGAGSRDSG